MSDKEGTESKKDESNIDPRRDVLCEESGGKPRVMNELRVFQNSIHETAK